MSGPVIIRLQNLPLEARSIDIRRFFEGLQIPDGGVHIIGGEKGDAFIAFQSDEDARLAMARDMLPLCNARIKLFLSSKTEMQNVIAAARNQQQQIAAAPAKTSLPSSIEQILFKSTQPVLANKIAAPPAATQNPAELLSSLTKLLSAPSQSELKPAAQPVVKADLDPISKTLATLLPMISQQKTATVSSATPVNATSNLISSLSQPQQNVQTSSSTSTAPKININQIFDMLQSQLKQSNTSSAPEVTPSAPSNTVHHSHHPIHEYSERPSRDSYQSSNNKSDYQQSSYSLSRGGGGGGGVSTAAPYRHEAPSAPVKYAPSNGSQPAKLDAIIRVKNFTPSASYKEIRTFLQGVQIEHDGIKLLHDANGQRTGQAFVRLIGIIDLKKALCRNKQFYEDRQIEVLQSNEHEFATTNVIAEYPAMQRHKNMRQQQEMRRAGRESARPDGGQQQQQQQQQQHDSDQESSQQGFYLKIYGLPASFDDQSLKAMFNNVKFVRISTAKPTPISTKIVNQDGTTENTTIVKAKKLCQVETQLDLEKALTRQDERVGKSKVQIYQINKSEYDRELSSIPPSRRGGSSYQGSSNNGNSNYSNGNQEEGNGREQHPHDTEYMDTSERIDNDAENGSNENDEDVYVYMHGVPFSARENEVKSFFPQHAQPRLISFLIDQETFKPTGECCCEFNSRAERERALVKDGQLLRNRVIKVRPIGKDEYREYITNLEELREKQPKRGARQVLLQTPMSPNEKPRLLSETLINLLKSQNNWSLKRSAPNTSSNQQKRIRSSPEPNSPPSSSPMVELPPLPAELQRYKRSIVLLSNVSFEATREDILELFRQYSPIEQTLKIRHDDAGQPTGDAIVACKNADEAFRACARLNGTNFMGRNIRAVMLEA